MKFTAFIFSILMFAGVANATGSGADCEQVTADVSLAENTNPQALESSNNNEEDTEGVE